MTTETTTALDEERMGAFVGQVLDEVGATLQRRARRDRATSSACTGRWPAPAR